MPKVQVPDGVEARMGLQLDVWCEVWGAHVMTCIALRFGTSGDSSFPSVMPMCWAPQRILTWIRLRTSVWRQLESMPQSLAVLQQTRWNIRLTQALVLPCQASGRPYAGKWTPRTLTLLASSKDLPLNLILMQGVASGRAMVLPSMAS